MLSRSKIIFIITSLFIIFAFVFPAIINYQQTRSGSSKLSSQTQASNENRTLKYLALGDSLAAGLNVERSYVDRYKSGLEKSSGLKLELVNLGQNSWTSRDLLYAIQTNTTFQEVIEDADIITLDIGGNDFLRARALYKAQQCGGVDKKDCFRETLQNFKVNWDSILNEINNRNNSLISFKTMDFYYPFVNEDLQASTIPLNGPSDFFVLKEYFNQINSYIRNNSVSKGIEVAEVSLRFNGYDGNIDPGSRGYLYQDGVHPNELGHETIAEQFLKLDHSKL